MMSHLPALLIALAATTVVQGFSPVTTSSAYQAAADAQFQEARRLFDSLDYEKAVAALDAAIVALEVSTPKDVARRDKLASAYEMRGRSKFGLGDQDGARADFVLLLKLNPSHTLSGQVSPRVVALFEEVLKETVTSITISVTPPTAKLQLDGMPLDAAGTVRVAAGDHVISAEQQGFRPAKQTVTAAIGTTAAAPIRHLSLAPSTPRVARSARRTTRWTAAGRASSPATGRRRFGLDGCNSSCREMSRWISTAPPACSWTSRARHPRHCCAEFLRR